MSDDCAPIALQPCIDSEVGRLRYVITHRPGRELDRLTPSNIPDLRFDDMPSAARAAWRLSSTGPPEMASPPARIVSLSAPPSIVNLLAAERDVVLVHGELVVSTAEEHKDNVEGVAIEAVRQCAVSESISGAFGIG